jgi:glycosyltransferase involved in cell wall biosynthesis
MAQHVRDRLAARPTPHELADAIDLRFRERPIVLKVERHAVEPEHGADDELGVEPGRADPLLFEERRGFLEHLDEGDHAGGLGTDGGGILARPSEHRLPRTVVVVPCYNEATRLDGATFRAWAATHPDVGFLFVDDGSTDDTRTVLGALKDDAALRILALDQNGGKAEAVRQGVLHALTLPGVERVGFWDADLATPLDAIPSFEAVLDARPEVEIVLGSRVRLLGRKVERKAARHYFGRVAATAVSSLFDFSVYDTQCGAKLFRVTPTLPALFAQPFVTRWIFDVEILVRWRNAAAPGTDLERHIVELPLERWTDVDGSKIKPHEFLLAPRELLRVWRTYRR